jgi:hypothetical protein
MDEELRLPMPVDGEDCLCRECLRKAAATSTTSHVDEPSERL